MSKMIEIAQGVEVSEESWNKRVEEINEANNWELSLEDWCFEYGPMLVHEFMERGA